MSDPYKKIVNLLRVNDARYGETEHQPVYTSQQLAKVRGVLEKQIAKSLLLKCGNDFIIAVLPGDRKLDNQKLKNLLKIRKFRFATPEEVKSKTHCEIGACYPFGNLIGLSTIVDKSMSKNKVIFFNPGLHNITMEIEWKDYYSIVKPQMVDISEK